VTLALLAAVAALATSESTAPAVHPASGARTAVFRVAFTPRHDLGRAGVLDTSYRIDVVRPARTRVACAPGTSTFVRSGRAGARRRVRLTAPAHGWCTGRYGVRVWLVQGPYCPPGHDSPCPEFATRETPAGRTSFRVRAA
jgi:hypothetical protein